MIIPYENDVNADEKEGYLKKWVKKFDNEYETGWDGEKSSNEENESQVEVRYILQVHQELTLLLI